MRRGTVELGYSLEKTERKRAIEKRKFQALNFQKMGILFITKDVPRHPNGGTKAISGRPPTWVHNIQRQP